MEVYTLDLLTPLSQLMRLRVVNGCLNPRLVNSYSTRPYKVLPQNAPVVGNINKTQHKFNETHIYYSLIAELVSLSLI